MEPLFIADKYGRLISRDRPTINHAPRKRRIPDSDARLGDQFGNWAGRELQYMALPGGAMLQFDLSQLSLADFRSMRDHYQINASLYVLTFILHQIDWHIECTNQEIREMIEQNMLDVWTSMIRGLSQAFWAGYSPMVMNLDNDVHSGYVKITKFKDLVPEECRVNWKKTEGYAPPGHVKPQILNYDGFIQTPLGSGLPSAIGNGPQQQRVIPAENTLWYPIQMENGDYYGRKLLKPAFPAWYFSQIIHLFNNRYLERFGEPTPVGRADYDDEVDMGGGSYVSGKKAMEQILGNLRSRAVVVLPSDRDGQGEYTYDIDYLESQMRGADFERYMSRLDEEMSLALFTPVLLFRTADVGSYNLGQAHLKIFLWMLNSIAADIKSYIQFYVVDRLKTINFGEDAPVASWVYRKLGKDDTNLYTAMMQAMVASGHVQPDLEELGTAIGLTLREVKEVTEVDPANDPDAPEVDPDPNQDTAPSVVASYPHSLDGARAVLTKAVVRAYNTAARGSTPKQFAYRGKFVEALVSSGADTATAQRIADKVYSKVPTHMTDLLQVFSAEPERFRDALGQTAGELLHRAVA